MEIFGGSWFTGAMVQWEKGGVLGKSLWAPLVSVSWGGPAVPLQAPTRAAVERDFPAAGEWLRVYPFAIAMQQSALRW